MVRSFSDRQRALLLAAATAVLYTPQREHFGIVPLEAMAAGRPVIACDSGGPRESVVDGRTGLLCEPSPAAFAHAMQALVVSPKPSFPRIPFRDRLGQDGGFKHLLGLNAKPKWLPFRRIPFKRIPFSIPSEICTTPQGIPFFWRIGFPLQ